MWVAVYCCGTTVLNQWSFRAVVPKLLAQVPLGWKNVFQVPFNLVTLISIFTALHLDANI